MGSGKASRAYGKDDVSTAHAHNTTLYRYGPARTIEVGQRWYEPRLANYFNRVAGSSKPFRGVHHFDQLEITIETGFQPPWLYPPPTIKPETGENPV